MSCRPWPRVGLAVWDRPGAPALRGAGAVCGSGLGGGGVSRSPSHLVAKQLVGAGEAEVEGRLRAAPSPPGWGRCVGPSGHRWRAARHRYPGLHPGTRPAALGHVQHGGSPGPRRGASGKDADATAQRCVSLGPRGPHTGWRGDWHVSLGVPVTGCQRPERRADPRAPEVHASLGKRPAGKTVPGAEGRPCWSLAVHSGELPRL